MCVGEYIVTILVATQDVAYMVQEFHCGEVQEVILHTSKIVGFFLVRL